MPRLAVDLSEVVAASAQARRTAQDVQAVAAHVGGLALPDTGAPTTSALVAELLQQAHVGARAMAAAVTSTGDLLGAIAVAYVVAEQAAGGGPCA